jgi:exopolysaccharide biosynthesis polyprenyl glycosylphosphotransferase
VGGLLGGRRSTVGLATAIWLTAYLALEREPGAHALLAVTVATVVWVVCLNSARRALPLVFGSSFVSATGTSVGLVLVSAIQPWVSPIGASMAPARLLLLAAAVFAVATLWWELVERGAGVTRRVMIVGTDAAADEVAAELAGSDGAPVEVVGTVHATAGEGADPGPARAEPSELSQVLEAQRPDLVVVADDRCCGAAIGTMLELGDASPQVVGLAGFFEHAYGRVPVRHLSPTWFMSLLHLRQRPYSRVAKRLFDLTGAALGLVLAAPLMAAIALILRRTRRPVLYRQVRVGQGGRLFEMFKFRTMRDGAEENGHPRWASENDPRATRFGRFLRRLHLDELPQLWNVLRGDMSLVGPRPERPDFIAELEEVVPYWGRRLLIKPGLTGWAQIQLGYASDVDGAAAKLSYDLWYLRHRSVVLDVAICVKTISSLLAGARGR